VNTSFTGLLPLSDVLNITGWQHENQVS